MTAIDYAALVERAKLGISIANDKRISQDAVGIVSELVAAIERLTQPGGEVEPVGKFIFNEIIAGWQQAPEDSDGELQYSAATVARLIAERDAAKQKHALLETEFLRSREAAGQIIVGRDVTISNLRAEVARLTAELAEANAAKARLNKNWCEEQQMRDAAENELAAAKVTTEAIRMQAQQAFDDRDVLRKELAELREQKPVESEKLNRKIVVVESVVGWDDSKEDVDIKARNARMAYENNILRDSLIWISRVNAMDYEYQKKAREALAATEPDGDALLFAAEAKQCNHDCNQGRNCTCRGGK